MVSLHPSRPHGHRTRVGRLIAAGVVMLLGAGAACSKPLPKAVVEAGCQRQMSAPFWKTWESKVTATPGWSQLPAAARQKLREAAEGQFAKELASEDGQRMLAECVATYGKLKNKAQLDCVIDANLAKAGKAAIEACLQR